MAVSITSGGIWFPPYANGAQWNGPTTAFASMTITVSNAVAFVGNVFIADRSPSKVLSSAGGRLMFRTGTTSVWTALSALGIGLQDVDATNGPPGRPDGAFDVSLTITSSTVTLTANTWHDFAMTSGAKTLSHGQLIAFVVRMGTRVSTDAASVGGLNAPGAGRQYPYAATLSAGTAWTATTAIPNAIFQCDDGTLAWLQNSIAVSSITSVSVSAGGANTEYGMRFALPWTCLIDTLQVVVSSTSIADTTVILYGDPNGTPTTVTSIALLGQQGPSTFANIVPLPLRDPVTITASTTYLLSALAGAGVTFTFNCMQFANAAYKVTVPGGSTMARGARAGGAGAFSMDEAAIPSGWGVRICEITPQTTTTTVTTTTTITTTIGGGAGGMLVHPGMVGGIRG